MRLTHTPMIVGLALASLGAVAQAPVLRGSQVTESALIEALAIEGPQAPADGATRGFGVVPAPSQKRRAADGGGAPAGKANLVMTFAVDSAELTADTTRMLDTVAKALQSDQLAGFAFRIEGHADPRGSEDWNQQLSAKRAAAVVGYLVERHGILAERLTSVGKGSSELLDAKKPNSQVNRRVTIVTNRS